MARQFDFGRVGRFFRARWLGVVSGAVAVLVVVPLGVAAAVGYAERTDLVASYTEAHRVAKAALAARDYASTELKKVADQKPAPAESKRIVADGGALLDATLSKAVTERAAELEQLLAAEVVADADNDSADAALREAPNLAVGAVELRATTDDLLRTFTDYNAESELRATAAAEIKKAQQQLRDALVALAKGARATAQGVLTAAPSADQASKDALEASLKALEAAAANGDGLGAAFTGYFTAAKAVTVSHEAAAAAAAKAAADAAARKARSGASGGAGSGAGGASGSGAGGTGTGSGGGATTTCSTQYSARVLQLVNQARADAGVGPLTLNAALQSAACQHSTDQAAHDQMSHTGSDGSSMSQRISAAGYRWGACAENVAAGYGSPESVFNGWMNSPGHRANILSGSYRDMGLATARSAGGTLYWTQTFGG